MSRKNEKSCGMSPADFKRLLDYDPETGVFRWKVDIRCGKNRRLFRKVGDIAGGMDDKGYITICINYMKFHGHRLAWFMTYGEWPAECVDHKNLVRSDNRIDNLRRASDLQNRSNTAVRARSGFKGVHQFKHAPGSYMAQITVDGRKKYLGCFPTPEEAHEAYKAAAAASFGEFARFG